MKCFSLFQQIVVGHTFTRVVVAQRLEKRACDLKVMGPIRQNLGGLAPLSLSPHRIHKAPFRRALKACSGRLGLSILLEM